MNELLRDEATEALFAHLERATLASLRVAVDHGQFRATYQTGHERWEGQRCPVLSDALNSLVAALVAPPSPEQEGRDD